MLPWRNCTSNSLSGYAPPSVIVNAEHEIMHLSEHAGRFLQFVGGEPTANLLRVIHPSLRLEVRAALFRAVESNAPVQAFDVPAEIDGQACRVHITVAPAAEIAPGFLLVIFEKQEAHAEVARAPTWLLPPRRNQ